MTLRLSHHTLLRGYACAISGLPCAFVSKRGLVQNFSYENEFDLDENEPVGKTRFHINGFARRLVLTQRQNATRE